MTCSRRELLRRALVGGGASLATGLLASACGPIGLGQPSSAAPTSGAAQRTGGRVYVRTAGGSYEEAIRASTWEPFTTATGIEVVPVPANSAKVLAMIEAGNVEIDILDMNEATLLTLQQRGALDPLDRSRFTRTDLRTVEPVTDYYVGYNVFAETIVYNIGSFGTSPPTSWADVWDVARFPGDRLLQDAKAITPPLEFALLADGVEPAALYPLDVERAFRALARIKPFVRKWYDTGAVGAELFLQKHVVLGALWNNRVQVLIDGGAPLAIEWNQAQRILEGAAIVRGAPNRDHAYQLLDFALQPEIQAAFARISLSPANRQAYNLIDAGTAARLPTSPVNLARTFTNNGAWWAANRADVAERWEEFLSA